MARCCNSYAEAIEFMDRMRDRYECRIVMVDGSWMVICER